MFVSFELCCIFAATNRQQKPYYYEKSIKNGGINAVCRGYDDSMRWQHFQQF